MSRKNELRKKITSVILIIALALSSAMITPTTVRAAGWIGNEQNFTLGTTVSGSFKDGDYNSKLYANSELSTYWHIYKISIPKNGQLSIYMESKSELYFKGTYNGYSHTYYVYFTIFSESDLDHCVWNSRTNEFSHNYSAARDRYYTSAGLTLDKGDYYFAVRSHDTIDEAYYLTLSYKEPNINITSISLDKKTLKLEPGEQATVNADVLPDNATDKTVVWESSDSSIASVENGIITAHSPGTATITAASSDGEISASCAVTVINTPAIDELEESQPTITNVQSGKRKVAVYYEPIYMDDVKYQISYRIGNGKWKIKNVSDSPATIRSLHSKRTYSVRVRGYKNIDGSVYYSSWSKSRRVKIR